MTFWPRESQDLDLDGQKEFDYSPGRNVGRFLVCRIPYASYRMPQIRQTDQPFTGQVDKIE